jgi:hypothetical protein
MGCYPHTLFARILSARTLRMAKWIQSRIQAGLNTILMEMSAKGDVFESGSLQR